MEQSLPLTAVAAAAMMKALAASREELQPCSAAVLLGVVQHDDLAKHALGGSSSSSRGGGKADIHSAPGAEGAMEEGDQGETGKERGEVRQASMLLVHLCCSQVPLDGDEDSVQDAANLFVPGLSPAAAAATMFAVCNWYWSFASVPAASSFTPTPPPAAVAAVHAGADTGPLSGPLLPSSPKAVGLLGLELYHAARSHTLSAGEGWTTKPRLDSLVFDLALIAAMYSADWHAGEC